MNYKFDKKEEELLKKAIVKTIAFFDLFNFPLADFEVWKWLWADFTSGPISFKGVEPPGHNASLQEVKSILENGELSNILETKNGFYFLRGRSETVKTRMVRYNYAGRKFARAVRVAKLLRFIPWIKMIAVGNIIGANNMQDEGDIDLFIVVAKKRIWITRFFAAAFMAVLNLRPQAGDMRDKICLSFFVSEEAMDLERLMLDNSPLPPFDKGGKEESDIYFIYWLAGLVPIYKAGNVYGKFVEANSWIKNYLSGWRPVEPARWRCVSGMPKIYRLAAGICGFLEPIFKKVQLKALPRAIKEMANKDTRVVVDDKILKFHTNDRREEYRKKWEEKTKFLNYNF